MAGRALLSSHNFLPSISGSRTSLSTVPRRLLLRRPTALASSVTCRLSHFRCEAAGEAGEPDKAARFVLTTPLYYVNAPPHMGSAYTTIAADAIARFQRLLGKKVIFITGTDEHGEKIATAAEASGSSPLKHCDTISQAYRILWKDLDIAYDKFIRTTDPRHEAVVKDFYTRVLNNGDIYRADYEGLYCVNCEEYKDEKELLENNYCPMHLKPCVLRKEDNYFFALSKYQNLIEEFLTSNPDFVKPSSRLNEVQNWVRSGLKDFSISRASVEWGIPVPSDNKQTIYVWFDALLGYISAMLEDGEQPSLQNASSSGWPASLHLIGKDILRFHAVYWPAMLMSAGLSLPVMIFGHGFLTKVEKARLHYENLSLSAACQCVLDIGNAGNLYIDEHVPWSLFKKGDASSEIAAKDLVIVLEAMRIIAIALSPVTPRLCSRIYAQLGYSEDQFETVTWSDTKWGGLKAGQQMGEPKPIFARIETGEEEGSGPKAMKDRRRVPRKQGVVEA